MLIKKVVLLIKNYLVMLTQLVQCYRNSDPSDIAVTAAGGLVGEVIQVWKPRELNTHETEWGFSCMSYEISGALGIKMANPDKEVIAHLLEMDHIYFTILIYIVQ